MAVTDDFKKGGLLLQVSFLIPSAYVQVVTHAPLNKR